MISPGVEGLPPWTFQKGLSRGLRNTWRHGGWTGRFLLLFPLISSALGMAYSIIALFLDAPIEAIYPILLTVFMGVINFVVWTGPATFSIRVLSTAETLPDYGTTFNLEEQRTIDAILAHLRRLGRGERDPAVTRIALALSVVHCVLLIVAASLYRLLGFEPVPYGSWTWFPAVYLLVYFPIYVAIFLVGTWNIASLISRARSAAGLPPRLSANS